MRQQKKKYLKSYLLQEPKIARMKNMIRLNSEFADTYKQKIADCLSLREKIEEQIRCVDDGVLSELLFQKYVFGKTLETISYTMNYSQRHIERLHIAALDKFKMD